MKFRNILLMLIVFMPVFSFAGVNNSTGYVISLLASGTEPAIRLTGNVSPSGCDGGTYGWLYFVGTAEEKSRVYSTALAMAISKNIVTVYTNSDGGVCRISNIQIISGLN